MHELIAPTCGKRDNPAALAWAANWPIFIDYSMVLLSFGVSGGVGVFFGYYPALKASRLDPIEALRYE